MAITHDFNGDTPAFLLRGLLRLPAGQEEPPIGRGKRRFTQADLISALRAAQKSGVPIAAVRIEPDGAIQIIPAKPDAVAVSGEPNDWD